MASKLSKLKMPSKKKDALEAKEELMHQDMDMDAEMDESPEHAEAVLMGEDEPEPGMGDEFGPLHEEDGSVEPLSEDMAEMPAQDLSEASDDDLIAELRKRGIAKDLDASDPESEEMPSAPKTSRYS